MVKPVKYLLILWALAFCWPTWQVAGQFVGKSYVINYDIRSYGGGNQSWSVAAGHDGMVYVGNDRGLLEFDGSNWRLYPMPGGGIIRSVCVGEDGLVYAGSFEEFGYWRRDQGGLVYQSLSSELVRQGTLHNDEIWRIVEHDGNLYFQSFSRIFVFDKKEITLLSPETSFVLLMEARSRLFIHMVDRGLYEVRPDTLLFIPGSAFLAGDEIKVMLPFGRSEYLAGASGSGLFLFDGTGFTRWDHPVNREIREASINNGLAGHGLIAIGTIGDGLYLFDQGGHFRHHLNTGNSLQNNTVLGLGFQPAGNLWVALDSGLDLVNLNTSLDFYVDPSGDLGTVYTAFADGTGLLVGTNQGLYRYRFADDHGFTDPAIIPGLQGQVWDLKNIEGEIYCGHNSGTYRLEEDRPVKISDISGGYELKSYRQGESQYLLQSTYSAFALYAQLAG
ncbi:MAG: hypothetical protein R6V75_02895, partial [Bacteroidales bacterium]